MGLPNLLHDLLLTLAVTGNEQNGRHFADNIFPSIFLKEDTWYFDSNYTELDLFLGV